MRAVDIGPKSFYLCAVNENQQRVRTFGVNMLLLLLINILIKPFYLFGIDRTVQNEVGAESYGLFTVFFNFIFLFQIFADLGLQNFSQQWIARQRGSVRSLLSRCLPTKWLLTLVFLPLVLLAGFISGYLREAPLLYALLVFNLLLNSWLVYLRTVVSGLGYYKTDSVFSSLDKLLMIIIVGWLLWIPSSPGISILNFAIAQTVSFSLAVGGVAIWVRWKIQPGRNRFSIKNVRVIFRKALPYALIVFLMTLFTRLDLIMIEWLLEDGYYQSGAYAAGFRLLDAANILGFLVAGLLLPMFSNASRQKQPPVDLARAGWFFLIAVSIPLSSLCFWYADEITFALYTEATAAWSHILSILMFTFIVRSSDYVMGSLLTAYERLRFLNICYVGGVVLNIGLNLFMIPAFDAVGAAYTTLFTQSLMAILFMIYAHRKILHSPLKRMLLRPVGFGIALVLWGFLLNQFKGPFYLSALVFLLGASAFVFAFGLLSPFLSIIWPQKFK